MKLELLKTIARSAKPLLMESLPGLDRIISEEIEKVPLNKDKDETEAVYIIHHEGDGMYISTAIFDSTYKVTRLTEQHKLSDFIKKLTDKAL